jgi:PAS domain S-box-containing protein
VKDYAIFMLSPEGNVLSWNAGAERIEGYRPEEIIGKHFSTFCTPEDVQRGKPARALTSAAEQGRCEDEAWRVRKDGSRFCANMVITALFDASRNLKGFSVVTRDITEHKKAEEAEKAVRHLSGCLLQAQDAERRRLGRELHDSTAQTLTALSIDIALLKESGDFSANTNATKILDELTNLAEQASREIRSISYLLHPPMLEEAGLPMALRWYAEGFEQRSKIAVELDTDPLIDRLPKEVEMALFRVAQESLTNIYRHSGSPTAKVRLALAGRELLLEVSDQGKGFVPASAAGNEGRIVPGVGISGMAERMRQIGGRLEIRPGSVGTIVKAVLPFGSPQYESPETNQEADNGHALPIS